MLITGADGHDVDIAVLDRLLLRRDLPTLIRQRIEREIRNIRAGERAERDAAYQIELYFGQSENWATIHDLRIEVDGLAAQMDHLIINRFAEVWVCESKSFAEGVAINEHGEWSRRWRGHWEGMPSPIEQNRRHMHLLTRAFDEGLAPVPRRLGFAPMKPRLRSLVVVSDNATIKRPRTKIDELEQVIKAEQLKTRLFDAFDANPARDMLRVIGKEGLNTFARGLAALHTPTAVDWAAKFGVAGQPGDTASTVREPVAPVPNAPQRDKPWHVKYDGTCSTCGRQLRTGTEAVWLRSERKMYCLDCRPPVRPVTDTT